MSSNVEPGGSAGLPPDDAFTVLGNETRIGILQALGESDEPLSFTELRDRVGVRQGGEFNYHLDRVVGHFVEKTDGGYLLRQPGRRVVQAVLSGAVTEDPTIERTELDQHCWWCGSPIEMSYREERVDLYCTGCEGTYGDLGARRPAPTAQHDRTIPSSLGYLGNLLLPPSGVTSRTAEEAYRAAWVWEMLEYIAISNNICPRCSGSIDASVHVCERHDTSDGVCETCGNQSAIDLHVRCRNCVFRNRVFFVHTLYDAPEFLAYLATNEVSPLRTESVVRMAHAMVPFDEEILSTDPFEARLTFVIGGETLALTVDENLSVVDVTEHEETD